MGVGKRLKGQSTVELAVFIPVFIAIAVIVFNACLYLENCASFDRLARDAVRVYGASPAAGQSLGGGVAYMQDYLSHEFSQDYLEVSVSSSGAGLDFTTYTATLLFRPTLFGHEFSGAVYGVLLHPLQHQVQITCDPYKPGLVV